MNFLKSLFGDRTTTSLNAREAKTQIEGDPSLLILDVRHPEEFQTGHIAGAKLIPLSDLQQRMHELPTDTAILCVCHSGSRSGAATHQLNHAGFKAMNLRGGMMSWQMAGFAVTKGK